MTTQQQTQPAPQRDRRNVLKIQDTHNVIIEISLWKPQNNTLLTVYSSLYEKPIHQYATFKSIHEALAYYKQQYEQAHFTVTNVHIYHVHADMFTAEFTATH